MGQAGKECWYHWAWWPWVSEKISQVLFNVFKSEQSFWCLMGQGTWMQGDRGSISLCPEEGEYLSTRSKSPSWIIHRVIRMTLLKWVLRSSSSQVNRAMKNH